MACNLCEARGKTWEGSDPTCAFAHNKFVIENWNCATINTLRDIVEESATWNQDQHCAILPIFENGEFLLLSWYKSRGKTEGAWVVDGSEVLPLTICEAEIIIKQYANNTMEHGHCRPTRKGESLK